MAENRRRKIKEGDDVEQKKIGFGRFFAVLLNPGEVFQELSESPSFAWPAIFNCVIFVAAFLMTLPKLIAYSITVLENNPAITPEMLANGKAIMPVSTAVGGILAGLAGLWLTWLIIAAILKLYDLVVNGETGFKKLFAAAVYGYLPNLIGAVVSDVVILLTPADNMKNVTISLAVFLTQRKGFLYNFLSSFNPFVIWSVILWGIGGAVMLKQKKPGGSIAVMLAVWLVWTVLIALFGTFLAGKVPGVS